jgi:hypothetical protein
VSEAKRKGKQSAVGEIPTEQLQAELSRRAALQQRSRGVSAQAQQRSMQDDGQQTDAQQNTAQNIPTRAINVLRSGPYRP